MTGSGAPRFLRRVMVSDRRLLGDEDWAEGLARRVVARDATALLLREKDLTARELLALATDLKRLISCPLIVAHRPEVARAAGAAGVHLGWKSPSIAQARAQLPPNLIIGVSVHDQGEGCDRAADGADYLIFGPIRPTPSKEGLVEARGFKALEELARRVKIPVIAIGGLSASDEARVRACGAAGLAAIRSFMETDG